MVDGLARMLGREPHPEGGYYQETYRAATQVQTPRGAIAAWHPVGSDEGWHFYDGALLTLYQLGGGWRRWCSAGTWRGASGPRSSFPPECRKRG